MPSDASTGGSPAWVTGLLCPALGCVICNIMWLSPMKAVLDTRSNMDLGSLNPIPFGITVINCIGWTMYGCMRKDFFIFWANMPGLVWGLYYVLSVVPFLSKKNPTPEQSLLKMIIEGLVVGGTFFWAYIAMIVFIILSPEERAQGELLVGSLGCACSLMYYASPLSTMRLVVQTGDSSSLYVPMICTNLANAVLWVSYGLFGLHDPVLWAPNAVGALLSISQLILAGAYHPIVRATVYRLVTGHDAPIKLADSKDVEDNFKPHDDDLQGTVIHSPLQYIPPGENRIDLDDKKHFSDNC